MEMHHCSKRADLLRNVSWTQLSPGSMFIAWSGGYQMAGLSFAKERDLVFASIVIRVHCRLLTGHLGANLRLMKRSV
jgi:hypothetical protein